MDCWLVACLLGSDWLVVELDDWLVVRLYRKLISLVFESEEWLVV